MLKSWLGDLSHKFLIVARILARQMLLSNIILKRFNGRELSFLKTSARPSEDFRDASSSFGVAQRQCTRRYKFRRNKNLRPSNIKATARRATKSCFQIDEEKVKTTFGWFSLRIRCIRSNLSIAKRQFGGCTGNLRSVRWSWNLLSLVLHWLSALPCIGLLVHSSWRLKLIQYKVVLAWIGKVIGEVYEGPECLVLISKLLFFLLKSKALRCLRQVPERGGHPCLLFHITWKYWFYSYWWCFIFRC